jgi:hypothetical protein
MSFIWDAVHTRVLAGLHDAGTQRISMSFAFTLGVTVEMGYKTPCLEDGFCSIFGV